MKKNNKNNKNNIKILIISIIILVIALVIIFISKQKLSYEITYNGINCPTPYVLFYSNVKYEYYEFYGDNTELKPNPLHSGHAPKGELNEKNVGSSLPIVKSQ